MKSYYMLALFILVTVFGCTKYEPIVYGSLSGQILNDFTQSPEEGILMYLLDRDGEIDSINYENGDLIIDSTFTDVTGTYSFDSLPVGLYTVVPFDLSLGFTHIEETDPFDFEIVTGENLVVDFKAAPSSRFSLYSITVDIVNPPYGDGIYESQLDLLVRRRFWVGWSPLISNFEEFRMTSEGGNSFSITFNREYGYFALFYSLDNFYQCELRVNGFYDVAKLTVFNFELFTPINNTPQTVRWEYDCSTEILTRIE